MTPQQKSAHCAESGRSAALERDDNLPTLTESSNHNGEDDPVAAPANESHDPPPCDLSAILACEAAEFAASEDDISRLSKIRTPRGTAITAARKDPKKDETADLASTGSSGSPPGFPYPVRGLGREVSCHPCLGDSRTGTGEGAEKDGLETSCLTFLPNLSSIIPSMLRKKASMEAAKELDN